MSKQPLNPSPDHPETLVEHVIESIRESIRHGRYLPGQRLVVADIASNFGVSVGPVREAIRRLTGEGILAFTPHRGATVRTFGEREIRELFQVREALEGYVARLAAENIHHGDYAEKLSACRDRLREAMDAEVVELTNARQQFHDLLYEIAGNSMLQEAALRHTFPLYRLYFNEMAGDDRARTSLREHEEIIEAILAGDAIRAERLMRAHLRSGATVVCELLDRTRTDLKRPEKA